MAYDPGDTLVRPIMMSTTGLVADEVANDFAFHFSATPTSTDYGNLFTAVSDFYRATQSNGHSVGEYISPAVNRSATHRIDMYQIKTPPIGSPIYTASWLGPVNPAAANPFPQEVAAVLSAQASYAGAPEFSGTTRPRARRRGRIYVGPLMTNSLQGTTAPYLLDSTFLQTLRQAAVKMAGDALAAGWLWCVWSRKDVALRQVIGGWTDDAPDTQRRRGPAASTRVTYTV